MLSELISIRTFAVKRAKAECMSFFLLQVLTGAGSGIFHFILPYIVYIAIDHIYYVGGLPCRGPITLWCRPFVPFRPISLNGWSQKLQIWRKFPPAHVTDIAILRAERSKFKPQGHTSSLHELLNRCRIVSRHCTRRSEANDWWNFSSENNACSIARRKDCISKSKWVNEYSITG